MMNQPDNYAVISPYGSASKEVTKMAITPQDIKDAKEAADKAERQIARQREVDKLAEKAAEKGGKGGKK
jgi:hypothetical protein